MPRPEHSMPQGSTFNLLIPKSSSRVDLVRQSPIAYSGTSLISTPLGSSPAVRIIENFISIIPLQRVRVRECHCSIFHESGKVCTCQPPMQSTIMWQWLCQWSKTHTSLAHPGIASWATFQSIHFCVSFFMPVLSLGHPSFLGQSNFSTYFWFESHNLGRPWAAVL